THARVISSVRCYSIIFFFFSSRRRHTRSKRDWSSDVCSSDLLPPHSPGWCPGQPRARRPALPPVRSRRTCRAHRRPRSPPPPAKIGRASCRERVESSVGGVALKEEKKE